MDGEGLDAFLALKKHKWENHMHNQKLLEVMIARSRLDDKYGEESTSEERVRNQLLCRKDLREKHGSAINAGLLDGVCALMSATDVTANIICVLDLSNLLILLENLETLIIKFDEDSGLRTDIAYAIILCPNMFRQGGPVNLSDELGQDDLSRLANNPLILEGLLASRGGSFKEFIETYNDGSEECKDIYEFVYCKINKVSHFLKATGTALNTVFSCSHDKMAVLLNTNENGTTTGELFVKLGIPSDFFMVLDTVTVTFENIHEKSLKDAIILLRVIVKFCVWAKLLIRRRSSHQLAVFA